MVGQLPVLYKYSAPPSKNLSLLQPKTHSNHYHSKTFIKQITKPNFTALTSSIFNLIQIINYGRFRVSDIGFIER